MKKYTDLTHFNGGDYVHFHETDDYSASIVKLPDDKNDWGNKNGHKAQFVTDGIMKEGSNWNYYIHLLNEYDKDDELIVSLATEEEIELFNELKREYEEGKEDE